jgi:hypothetical protein
VRRATHRPSAGPRVPRKKGRYIQEKENQFTFQESVSQSEVRDGLPHPVAGSFGFFPSVQRHLFPFLLVFFHSL